MKPLTIGLDLDGVIYDWDTAVRVLVMDYWGINVADSTHWDSVKESCSPEIWQWLWTDGVKRGMFRKCAYHGAVPFARRLMHWGEVQIITSRPESARHDTLLWLVENHIISSANEITVHIIGNTASKADIPCDVYIDDSSRVARDVLAATTARMLLFDRPWNQGFPEHERCMRVFNYQDVFEALMKIKELP